MNYLLWDFLPTWIIKVIQFWYLIVIKLLRYKRYNELLKFYQSKSKYYSAVSDKYF